MNKFKTEKKFPSGIINRLIGTVIQYQKGKRLIIITSKLG